MKIKLFILLFFSPTLLRAQIHLGRYELNTYVGVYIDFIKNNEFIYRGYTEMIPVNDKIVRGKYEVRNDTLILNSYSKPHYKIKNIQKYNSSVSVDSIKITVVSKDANCINEIRVNDIIYGLGQIQYHFSYDMDTAIYLFCKPKGKIKYIILYCMNGAVAYPAIKITDKVNDISVWPTFPSKKDIIPMYNYIFDQKYIINNDSLFRIDNNKILKFPYVYQRRK